ncbi:MAG: SprB repeat-containing protein [Bacteroidales bacterium]|nr:SprB repeat-containing protein [Bacteroidales bacterium]
MTDVKCFGASTGAIDLTVEKGTSPFTFVWSNGATSEDLNNIPAGTYSVTVYDAKQCSVTLSNLVVGQPASGISASAVVTNISVFGANDGAIDVTVSGGTPPYSFLWNTGATTEDLSGLGPGTYYVTITDANGCNTAIRGLLVEEPEQEKPKGEMAFARKTYDPMVHCFLDLDLNGDGTKDFDTWGWTNGAMYPDPTFESTYFLYMKASGCDVSNAVKVGVVKLHYYAGVATVKITLEEGYVMNHTSVYIGNDMLPKEGGNYTTDPAFYPYQHDLTNATSDTFTVNGLSGNIYIIVNARILPAVE